MFNCSFCDDPIPRGTGIIYAKKDGTVFRFCSSKCKKNQLTLKREGRRQGWTTAGKNFRESTTKKNEKVSVKKEKK